MLTETVETYVALRRAAGFAFKSEGSCLKSFAAFCDARGESYVRAPVAIEWAGSAQFVPQRARRLGIVIRLARYLRAEDNRHEVHPAVFWCLWVGGFWFLFFASHFFAAPNLMFLWPLPRFLFPKRPRARCRTSCPSIRFGS
jgi:hypothetical protein